MIVEWIVLLFIWLFGLSFKSQTNLKGLTEYSHRVASHQLVHIKGWRRYSFFYVFQNDSYRIIKKGWNVDLVDIFICLAIYLTSIDGNFISTPFIDLAIFSIQWRKSGVEVTTDQGPTDQIPCKSIGISDLHCALHPHMLTNAKSVVTFEIGVIPW